MWTPQWDSRLMVEPTVLVIPTMRAPRCLQYLNALSVSAVSPDWDMKKQTSSLNLEIFWNSYWWFIDIHNLHIINSKIKVMYRKFIIYLKIGVFLSKKSDAKSNITGSSVNSSRRALDAMAEWYEVPQPINNKRRHLLISGMKSLIPPKVTLNDQNILQVALFPSHWCF